MIVIETPDSRGGSDGFEASNVNLKYVMQLELDESEQNLRSWVSTNAPKFVDPFGTGSIGDRYYLKNVSITPNKDGVMVFNVEVSYTQPKPSTISFQSSAGSQKIRYSLNTRNSFVPQGKIAPDFKKGINVTKDSIEGVEIVIPQTTVKVTRSWAASEITEDYLDVLDKLVGSINQNPLALDVNGYRRSYKRWEVRFDGADVQPTADYRVEITYSLTISRGIDPNDPKTHQFVGEIKVDNKPGWDYLWVHYEEAVNPLTHTRIAEPIAVYVEQVYREEDLDTLRLNG